MYQNASKLVLNDFEQLLMNHLILYGAKRNEVSELTTIVCALITCIILQSYKIKNKDEHLFVNFCKHIYEILR